MSSSGSPFGRGIGTLSAPVEDTAVPLIRPGENQWVIKDPTPKARLLWDDPQQPQLQGMAYLRVFTLPQVTAIAGVAGSQNVAPVS